MRDYYLVCQRSGMYRDGRNCEGLCKGCKAVAAVNRMSARHVDLFLSNSDYVAGVHRENGAFRPGPGLPRAVEREPAGARPGAAEDRREGRFRQHRARRPVEARVDKLLDPRRWRWRSDRALGSCGSRATATRPTCGAEGTTATCRTSPSPAGARPRTSTPSSTC